MKKLPVLLLFLIVLAGKDAMGQGSNIETLDSVLHLSAQTFDKWVEDQFKLVIKGDLFPDTLLKAVMYRLKKDMWTSDYAVVKCANSWLSYDNKEKVDVMIRDEGIPYKEEFRNSVEYIDSILPLLYKRDLLKMKLLNEKLRHLVYLEEEKQAREIIDEIIKTSEEVFYKANEIRLSSYLQEGKFFLSSDENSKAIESFAEVLSFPFYSTKDRRYRQRYEDLYISAGIGLIRSREDDLSALKHTFFYVPARPVLDPIRDEAIKKLEEKNGKN